MALQPPSFNQLLKLYKALGLSTGIPTLQTSNTSLSLSLYISSPLVLVFLHLGLSTGIPTLQISNTMSSLSLYISTPLFLSLFTIALPRITFAHGTSPFTQEQFKAGRAGEDKGWNGHGLKVDLHQFLIFGYLSWKFSLLSTAKI